jgi:hypothetical protein
MIWQLALRNLGFRRWRTVLLLLGYGLGVAVMVVLLSVGDAMIAQASDEKLVGGGDVTVLPEGLDVEVMKTGGVGGLFFSIANARFLHQQVLASPRRTDDVVAVSPQIENKLLYLRTAAGIEIPVRAGADLPDATRAVGAAPPLAAGTWVSDAGDRRWGTPRDDERVHDADHFHLPPAAVARRESWGEWHYFNVISSDAQRWWFITYAVGGAVPTGRWGGTFLVTMHERGRAPRRFTMPVPAERVRLSMRDADLTLGENTVRVQSTGAYQVRGTARDEQGRAIALDLVVTPQRGAFFPGAIIAGGDAPSGYAVMGLRAAATGRICLESQCETVTDAQAYHDHNWGTWQGVTWEWGAARVGSYTVLYGRVTPPDGASRADAPLFVYLVDSVGFRAAFRPRAIQYDDGPSALREGPARVPRAALLADVRGSDTLMLRLTIDDVAASDTRQDLVERGEGAYARQLKTPWFLQMAGVASLSGRVGGRAIGGTGRGFFETYR